MKYLIEITVDSNDADYIKETYVGTDKDIEDIKLMLSYLKLFYDKYAELYNVCKPHHGDVLDELHKCFCVLAGCDFYSIKEEEFLKFVENNLEKAEYLTDWVETHWPCDGSEPGHTLVSIMAYELKKTDPMPIYRTH